MAAIAGCLVVVSIALVSGSNEASWLLLAVILVVFSGAELLVINLPTTKSAHGYTFREIPAVAGFVLLSPAQYVFAFVVGAGLVKLIRWRQRRLKLCFNLALFSLEASLGVLAFHVLLGSAEPTEPRAWLAAVLAVVLTDVVSTGALTLAIALTEQGNHASTMREALRFGLAAAVINTCLALLVLVLVQERPAALLLLSLMVGLLIVGYRLYLSVVDGHARLQLLYRFVGSTGRAAELTEAMTSVLAEASTLLRSDRAELLLLQPPGSTVRFRLDGSGQLVRSTLEKSVASSAWWARAGEGEAVLLPHHDADHVQVAGDVVRDGIAVPITTEGDQDSVFLVADRTFEEETFDAQDLQLFETLAAHAAVTLDKARLVDRLRRVAEERAHEALHDPLTGLPNRRAFNEAVAAVLSAGRGGAVLLMDLDDFKDVNDTLGHSAGDQLLQVTGRRLRQVVVGDDGAGAVGTVARLGGDEFAVLLPGSSIESAVLQARELLNAVNAPVPLHDITLTTTASFGVAPVPHDAEDTDELLVHADVAMYAAKAAGSGVEVYQPEDTDATHRRLALAGELPTAIDVRSFDVWYQPQVDARTGEVTGVEALLRWDHPVYGSVPPTEVVAIAERTGLLRRLTDAVLTEAVHQRARWAAGGHELDVAVNVTPRDLADVNLPATVGRLLAATGTPPSALVIEITENGVMSDPERSLEVLDALDAMGVRVSVDDFGTGHSSLAYLERLPVHELKIDQSFVLRLEREATDVTVVRSIVTLAHDLGLRVVAEGVESDVARERVTALGCELVQGFGLARPMTGDEVTVWLGDYVRRPREIIAS